MGDEGTYKLREELKAACQVKNKRTLRTVVNTCEHYQFPKMLKQTLLAITSQLEVDEISWGEAIKGLQTTCRAIVQAELLAVVENQKEENATAVKVDKDDGRETKKEARVVNSITKAAKSNKSTIYSIPKPKRFGKCKTTIVIPSDISRAAERCGLKAASGGGYTYLHDQWLIVVNARALNIPKAEAFDLIRQKIKLKCGKDFVDMGAELGYTAHAQRRGYALSWFIEDKIYDELRDCGGKVMKWGLPF